MALLNSRIDEKNQADQTFLLTPLQLLVCADTYDGFGDVAGDRPA